MSLVKKPEMTEKKVAGNRRKRKLVHGPSPYERAAEIAPTHPNARVLRRMQDSNFREVRRVTNLLLKLKRYERRMEALGNGDEKHSRVSRDILENK